MSGAEKEILRTAEASLHNGEICRYNINGVCILSDCPCQAMADGHTVCSSFKKCPNKD